MQVDRTVEQPVSMMCTNHQGPARNMVGISQDRMVDQVSRAARWRWGTGCHRFKPVVVIGKFLTFHALRFHPALRAATHTCCGHLVPVPITWRHQWVWTVAAGLDCPRGPLQPPPVPKGLSGQQQLFPPAAGTYPDCTINLGCVWGFWWMGDWPTVGGFGWGCSRWTKTCPCAHHSLVTHSSFHCAWICALGHSLMIMVLCKDGLVFWNVLI